VAPIRALRAPVLAALLLGACAAAGGPSGGASMSPGAGGSPAAALRYVALGDSYTIGTSVGEADRWPDRLVARLAGTVPGLDLVANLGVDGRTSADLIADQLPRLDGLRPGFVTLLIGVNDVVQGVSAESYRSNASLILDALTARLPPDRIVAVSIPDYTVTPAGAGYGDPAVQSARIRAENALLAGLCAARGIAFVDITGISLRAAADRSLVATDGLHPSGAQYALWVERIAPVVAALLGRSDPPGVGAGP
jgi:lysophospholipase L1-like esterase